MLKRLKKYCEECKNKEKAQCWTTCSCKISQRNSSTS